MAHGKIIIITAPSGAGKTTLVKRLLAACPELAFSVSACTRPPRSGEIHGRDYYFYNEAQFRALIETNSFAEWEMVYAGKYYGTLRSELHRIWDARQVPLVDIDVKGALAIQEQYPDAGLSIFVQPPSLDVLRQRLRQRGSETPQSLDERVSKAGFELSFATRFDKIIINDDLDAASAELSDVVRAFLDGVMPDKLSQHEW